MTGLQAGLIALDFLARHENKASSYPSKKHSVRVVKGMDKCEKCLG
jgi:hypothetical protein